MIEVFVTIAFKGKNYQTNVITYKGVTGATVKRLAEEQVVRQWSE